MELVAKILQSAQKKFGQDEMRFFYFSAKIYVLLCLWGKTPIPWGKVASGGRLTLLYILQIQIKY